METDSFSSNGLYAMVLLPHFIEKLIDREVRAADEALLKLEQWSKGEDPRTRETRARHRHSGAVRTSERLASVDLHGRGDRRGARSSRGSQATTTTGVRYPLVERHRPRY